MTLTTIFVYKSVCACAFSTTCALFVRGVIVNVFFVYLFVWRSTFIWMTKWLITFKRLHRLLDHKQHHHFIMSSENQHIEDDIEPRERWGFFIYILNKLHKKSDDETKIYEKLASWFRSWFPYLRWVPTSPVLLKEAEENILECKFLCLSNSSTYKNVTQSLSVLLSCQDVQNE